MEDQRSSTINQLETALNELYNWARVVEKNRADFTHLERRLAGMIGEDAVRGLGYIARADLFNERLL